MRCSLYIHLPWCIQKCPYCDFNSHTAPKNIPQIDYVQALLCDLQIQLQYIGQPVTVSSLFIGGGTPSLFSGGAIAKLLEGVHDLCAIGDCEVTLEANPGTADSQFFAAYRAAGVNRLSLGVQSFNDAQLRQLGRIHDSKQAHAAIQLAQQYFDNINIDLMFALPGQSIEEARNDLSEAIAYSPQHISYYQLTLEPNTPFFRNPPPLLLQEDEGATISDEGIKLLAEHGYQRYEISAFCQPDKQCQHNLNYWQFGDYIGIGCGAHGKITANNAQRTRHTATPTHYLQHIAHKKLPYMQALEPQDLEFEFMLGMARLCEGFTWSNVCEHDIPLQSMQKRIDKLIARGLLEECNNRIRPTDLGLRFNNDVQAAFL